MGQKLYQYYVFDPPTEITDPEFTNLSISGISTFSSFYLSGGFYDSNNAVGSSGQILSSNGSGTLWINASTTSVGSATSVGINLDTANASRYLTFVESTSGNNIIRVDSALTFNPSTNNLGVNTTNPTSRLHVFGDARITGILTVGTSSITFDGNTDTARIGTGVTIQSGIVSATSYFASGQRRVVAFAAGTTTLFYQASAPTGWTKSTTHDNKALRVVSGTGGGSGGSTAFTTVFASRTPSGSVSGTNSGGSVTGTVSGTNSGGSVTGSVSGSNSGGSVTGSVSGSNSGGSVSNTTLTTTEMPSHDHNGPGGSKFFYSGPVIGIAYEYPVGSGFDPGPNFTEGWFRRIFTTSTGSSGSHGHGFTNPSWSGSWSQGTFTNPTWSGSWSQGVFTNPTWSGSWSQGVFTNPTWSGSFSGSAMDFAVQYIDMIICSID